MPETQVYTTYSRANEGMSAFWDENSTWLREGIQIRDTVGSKISINQNLNSSEM